MIDDLIPLGEMAYYDQHLVKVVGYDKNYYKLDEEDFQVRLIYLIEVTFPPSFSAVYGEIPERWKYLIHNCEETLKGVNNKHWHLWASHRELVNVNSLSYQMSREIKKA